MIIFVYGFAELEVKVSFDSTIQPRPETGITLIKISSIGKAQ